MVCVELVVKVEKVEGGVSNHNKCNAHKVGTKLEKVGVFVQACSIKCMIFS